jgi:hypothetical protein
MVRRRNPRAYHGTTARFSAFTTDRVGMTHGMGYGWGVYFTSDPGVAAAYAGKTGRVYGAKLPDGPWLVWSGRGTNARLMPLLLKIAKEFRLVMVGDWPDGEEFYQELSSRDWYSGGNFYRKIADFLNDHEREDNPAPGKITSKFLHRHGIIGIEYQQPSSRLSNGNITPEGATNYVVFDADDVGLAEEVSQ